MAEIHNNHEFHKEPEIPEEDIVLSNIMSEERLERIKNILNKGKIDIPDEIKDLIKKISEKLFRDSDAVRDEGVEKYLKSDSAELKTVGAVETLKGMIEKAQDEKRELSPKEIDSAKKLFEEAVMSWREEKNDTVANDLEELSANMDALIAVLAVEDRY